MGTFQSIITSKKYKIGTKSYNALYITYKGKTKMLRKPYRNNSFENVNMVPDWNFLKDKTLQNLVGKNVNIINYIIEQDFCIINNIPKILE